MVLILIQYYSVVDMHRAIFNNYKDIETIKYPNPTVIFFDRLFPEIHSPIRYRTINKIINSNGLYKI